MDDFEDRADDVLKEHGENAPAPDLTGMSELFPILASAKQIFDVAKMNGFTDAQAFQLARDYFIEIMRHAAAQA